MEDQHFLHFSADFIEYDVSRQESTMSLKSIRGSLTSGYHKRRILAQAGSLELRAILIGLRCNRANVALIRKVSQLSLSIIRCNATSIDRSNSKPKISKKTMHLCERDD